MNQRAHAPKAVAIVGPSNAGKTELVCRLLGWFQSQGLEVAVLKHSHKLNLGDEAKDTGRYRQAGARNLALAGPGLLQITRCLPADPPVEQVLAAVRKLSGNVIGVGILVDRSEDKLSFDVPLFACLRAKTITYQPATCPLCAAGVPLVKPGGG